MSRRVFLCYQHRDHGRARGFNLMRYAPNSKLEYRAASPGARRLDERGLYR